MTTALHGRMGGHYALAAGLLAASLGASLLFVPSTYERAAMHLRDREFDQARLLFEQRYLTAGPSVASAVPLARLYAQEGDLDAAIAVLRALVDSGLEPPQTLEARRLLSVYLRWSGRQGELADNLAAVAAADPNAATLRELAALDEFLGRGAARLDALAALVEKQDARPSDALDLAELRAQRRDFAGAMAALETVERRWPEAIDAGAIELKLYMQLELGRFADATEAAQRHLRRRPFAPDVQAVVETFGAFGRPALAFAALGDLVKPPTGDARIDLLLLRLAVEADEIGAARAAFDAILRGRIDAWPPPALAQLVEIAFAIDRAGAAFELARALDPRAASDAQLGAIARRAIDAERFDFLREFVARVGQARFERPPALGGEVAFGLGDRLRALALAREAAAMPDAALADSLVAASLLARLDRPAEALALLARLADRPELPDQAAVDLANLYVALRRAPEGLPVLERLRARRPGSLDIALGWAIVAAQAGRGEAVLAWLRGQAPDAVPVATLRDLFFLGAEARAPALQIEAGRRWRALDDSPETRLRLSQALLASGDAAGALALTRAEREWPDALREEAGFLRRDALRAVAGRDPAAMAELRNDWRARLAAPERAVSDEALYALIELRDWEAVLPALAARARADPREWLGAYVAAASDARRTDAVPALLTEIAGRADLPEATRREAIFALIERTPPERHLPVLRRAAAEWGGEWIDALDAALTLAGRRDELRALLVERGRDARGTAEARRAAAFRLLDLGDKAGALAVFQRLAESEPADGVNAQQARFLMGPRPAPAELDWLEARARASDGVVKLGWVRALAEAGAPARAANALAPLLAVPGRLGADAALATAEFWLTTGARADRPRAAAAIEPRVAREVDPTRALRLADIALAIERPDLARQAYARALVLEPTSRPALRAAGLFAFADGDFEGAKRHLERFLAPGAPGDWEAPYFLGESLYRLRDRAGARPRHEQALAAIDATANAPFAARAARAYLLYRLGRTEESVALYARLLGERPRDRDLRADYAGVLLELGRRAEAEVVLGGRS
jgi:cellulose synthase operon protein C